MLLDSVIRRLEIIGVAAHKVSKEIKRRYNKIPWREIVDTRNRVSHDYDAVDIDLIWEIVTGDLPQLKKQVQIIFDDLSVLERK